MILLLAIKLTYLNGTKTLPERNNESRTQSALPVRQRQKIQKTLSVIESADELREEADLDESGRILRVEIPWTRKNSSKKAKLDNTVMGRLAIDEHRLAVEVNSARRAKIIRTEIEKRLGKHAHY